MKKSRGVVNTRLSQKAVVKKYHMKTMDEVNIEKWLLSLKKMALIMLSTLSTFNTNINNHTLY